MPGFGTTKHESLHGIFTQHSALNTQHSVLSRQLRVTIFAGEAAQGRVAILYALGFAKSYLPMQARGKHYLYFEC
jgi:hypothetical protein